MKSFLSGSFVYGIPTVESDVDLVIFCDENIAKFLYEMLDDGTTTNSLTTSCGSLSVTHGSLNLICCWTEWSYNIWVKGTAELTNIKPVTREQAVSYFADLRSLK